MDESFLQFIKSVIFILNAERRGHSAEGRKSDVQQGGGAAVTDRDRIAEANGLLLDWLRATEREYEPPERTELRRRTIAHLERETEPETEA